MTLQDVRTLVYRCEIDSVPVALLRPDWAAGKEQYFNGKSIYGGEYDEGEAYLYFCRASLEYLERTGRNPDIIHLHEWQTAAAAMLYWDHFQQNTRLDRPKITLTIHNAANSGEMPQDKFAITGFHGSIFRWDHG